MWDLAALDRQVQRLQDHLDAHTFTRFVEDEAFAKSVFESYEAITRVHRI